MNDDGKVVRTNSSDYKREASTNIEYTRIVEEATEFDNVECDCWGAMVFLIVADLPDLLYGHLDKVKKFRIVFGTIVFIINLLIQGLLLVFIVNMLMLPSFHEAQDLYKTFHANAFKNNQPSQELFLELDQDKQAKLCQMALTWRFFTQIILFLWVSTNLGEFSIVFHHMRIVLNLAPLPDETDSRLMVHDIVETEYREANVICLSAAPRISLIVFIYLPKMLISVILTLTGSFWLMAAESLKDLILNSLALAFVTSVDELIAGVFFPQSFKDELLALRYASKRDPDLDDKEKAVWKRTLSYFKGFFTLGVSIVLVELLLNFQPVLPYYKQDVNSICKKYTQAQVPWCFPGNSTCFPIAQ